MVSVLKITSIGGKASEKWCSVLLEHTVWLILLSEFLFHFLVCIPSGLLKRHSAETILKKIRDLHAANQMISTPFSSFLIICYV